MARNVWDAWLQGGNAPPASSANRSTTGYSPLTGLNAPRTPTAFRPNLMSNEDVAGGETPLGKIGTSVPGAWYADVPQTSFSDFISEGGADRFRRAYAQSRGLGDQTEQSLARFSPLPQYWLAAMGEDKKYGVGTPNAPQRQADLMGQFYNRILGSHSGYIDPQAIMKNIVGSVYNSQHPGQNSYIQNLISNPSLDADSQVSNFWNFVNGTVGRLLPQGTMSAYQNLIERESNLYKDFMSNNPTVSLTFNKWIAQRLGPSGGL